MSLKSVVGASGGLRGLLFPLFARLNPGDVTIRHHYTGDALRLHSFRHRGYWWHGRDREADTMEAFRGLIRPGFTVFDVGTHIGYISLYFAYLVGRAGRVHSFEPGENNLPYTRRNLAGHANITVVEKALGAEPGRATLYLEDLSGQNNSLVQSYKGLALSSGSAVRAHVREVSVEVSTLDTYVASTGAVPDFVKIDVEGFELGVLQGADDVLRNRRPMWMVETAGESADAVLALFRSHGYTAYRPDGTVVTRRDELVVNTCFLHPERHADAIRGLGWPVVPPS